MGYDIIFHPAPKGLDPRDAEAVDAWIAAPPQQPAVALDVLEALADELAASIDATVEVVGRTVTLLADAHGFFIELRPTSGHYEGSARGVSRAWDAIETICERCGWAVYDPQRGKITFGIDLTCAECRSKNAPDASECSVCGTSLDSAPLPDAAVVAPATWAKRALTLLVERDLFVVKPVQRKAARAALESIAEAFHRDGMAAVATLRAKVELHGDDADLVALLQTLD